MTARAAAPADSSNCRPTRSSLPPSFTDTDGDALVDGEEVFLGTDPTLADTDGDGFDDLAEEQAATSPLDPTTIRRPLADELGLAFAQTSSSGQGSSTSSVSPQA